MQERAIVTVMSGSEQVVVVLGTGEGKSMLFMLPCVLPDTGITILILPHVETCSAEYGSSQSITGSGHRTKHGLPSWRL